MIQLETDVIRSYHICMEMGSSVIDGQGEHVVGSCIASRIKLEFYNHNIIIIFSSCLFIIYMLL